MKVLYIGSDSLKSGASYSMVQLIIEEAKLGVEVVPVVHEGNTDDVLNKLCINHYIVNSWSWMVSLEYSKIKQKTFGFAKHILNIPAYFKYKKIIKRENPDIIHINALTTYSAVVAALSTKIPIIWHIRELIEEDLNGCIWNSKYAYSLMRKSDKFIAISSCVYDKYSPLVSPDKIKLIYNGVDANRFYDPNHKILENDTIVLTMAGRITKEKGQFKCLKGLASILKKNKNIVLQYAGTGDENELRRMREFIVEEDIPESNIKFLGFIDNIEKIWSDTDIAIVYSKFEAFGRVTVEAKMAGAIVVGFDSGGTSELIEDGIDGYLFDNENRTLEKRVELILENKDRSKKIARNGMEISRVKFNSEKNAKEIVDLYKEVMFDNRK